MFKKAWRTICVALAMSAIVTPQHTVAQTTSSINFAPISSQSISAGQITISATSTSGQSVAFTSATNSICRVTNSTVSLINVGTCLIYANQLGVQPVGQSFSITSPTPVASLLSPMNNQTFVAGTVVTFTAAAADANGAPLRQIQFYEGATLLGSSTTPPYSIAISSPSVGSHTYTAVATTISGNSITSSPNTIAVVPQQTLASQPWVFGIADSNLIWVQPPIDSNSSVPWQTQLAPAWKNADTLIDNIAGLGTTWFRDGFSNNNVMEMASFVNEVQEVKNKNMKMLAIIFHNAKRDYLPGTGSPQPTANPSDVAAVKVRCGGSIPLGISQMDLTPGGLFETRIRNQLNAIVAAGLTIDAFEIDNEIDDVCNNGDVPFQTQTSSAIQPQVDAAADGYASFVLKSISIIKSYPEFANSRIITFGVENEYQGSSASGGYFLKAADLSEFFWQLSQDLNSPSHNQQRNYPNYLPGVSNWSLVDGFGDHIYSIQGPSEPQSSSYYTTSPIGSTPLKQSISTYLNNSQNNSLTNKPIWVTEWGMTVPYSDKTLFPVQKNEAAPASQYDPSAAGYAARAADMTAFMQNLQNVSTDSHNPIVAAFSYSYQEFLAVGANPDSKPPFSPLPYQSTQFELVNSMNQPVPELTSVFTTKAMPTCTLAANLSNITVSGPVTLTANCQGNVTGYTWSTSTGTSLGETPANTLPVTPSATTTYAVQAWDIGIGSIPALTTVTVAPPVAPQCTSASADPSSISSSAPVTLTVQCQGNVTTYTWSIGSQLQGTTSANSFGVTPTATTTYNIQAWNGSVGSNTVSVTVPIVPPVAPNCISASANPSSTSGSAPVTLTVQCQGNITAYTWGDSSKVLGTTSGNTFSVAPTVTTTYWIQAWDISAGSNAVSVTVPVTAPVAPNCISASANPSSTSGSTSVTLTVQCQGNITAYTWGDSSKVLGTTSSNSFVVAPTATTTYWIQAWDISAGSNAVSVTVPIAPPVAPTCTINATPSKLTAPGNVTLTANCSGTATGYSWFNGGTLLTTTTTNSYVVPVNATSTFYLQAWNISAGSIPAGVTVSVAN